MGISKPMICAGCFLTSAINIRKYISGLRRKRGSSAMRLVFALIGLLIGVLTLMSYQVDRAHMRARAAGESYDLDDLGFEDDVPDDVTVCFEDCPDWESV